MTEHQVTPSLLLNAAATLGFQQQRATHERWVTLSLRVGFRELIFNQADGLVDIFIRAMEEETKRRHDNNHSPVDFHLTLQNTLSRYWVCSWYEVIRRIQEKRGRVAQLLALRRKLELVRVPLAKFQIANDRKVKEPIYFVKQSGPSAEPEPYTARERLEYNPVHQISTVTGSIGWHVYDTAAKRPVDIFRRDISDEILELWGSTEKP